jgi:hypothetical protein
MYKSKFDIVQPYVSQPRTGQGRGKGGGVGEREMERGKRYIGGPAQVQCGPPWRRPAMYTTHGQDK